VRTIFIVSCAVILLAGVVNARRKWKEAKAEEARQEKRKRILVEFPWFDV